MISLPRADATTPALHPPTPSPTSVRQILLEAPDQAFMATNATKLSRVAITSSIAISPGAASDSGGWVGHPESTRQETARASATRKMSAGARNAAVSGRLQPRSVATKGTVTLIEKCSGAVGFEAVATEHRWIVHISGGSVGRGDLTPDREAVGHLGSPVRPEGLVVDHVGG